MGGEMKVLFLSSEVVPFASTGGLGDVCRALPLALRDLGVEVEIAMPLYRMVLERGFSPRPFREALPVELGTKGLTADLYRGDLEGIPVYFVRRDEFFDRSHLYGTPKGAYSDNAERFLFFTKALLSFGDSLGWPWDVIHCHDWHVALLPVYLKARGQLRPKVMLTVHNFGYQGDFPPEVLPLLDLPRRFSRELEHRGKVNFLKGGIVFSDLLTTVSPTYAREVQTSELGFGLQEVIRAHGRKLVGILNGVDYSIWDPRRDPFIAAHYGPEDLSGKGVCKEDLLRTLGLPLEMMEAPFFGMVSRLASQKGLDILLPVIPRLIEQGGGLVVLGTGEERYEEGLRELAARFPRQMRAEIAFDEELAHKIEAGCDIYLMPSLYEPCGLNQMYSLRYGTLPVVRNTGGLADTVEAIGPRSDRGTGFKFQLFRPPYLWRAMKRAMGCFHQRDLWLGLMQQAMRVDFSWERSARRYVELYRRLLS